MAVQKFQIGDRVKPKEDLSFVIADIRMQGGRIEYSGHRRPWYSEQFLILAPDRPPYVASERLVLERTPNRNRCKTDAELVARHQRERDHIARSIADLYRCENDAEMAARHVIELAARHAVERAEYDAQGDRV